MERSGGYAIVSFMRKQQEAAHSRRQILSGMNDGRKVRHGVQHTPWRHLPGLNPADRRTDVGVSPATGQHLDR
jgi:hypothetical protein